MTKTRRVSTTLGALRAMTAGPIVVTTGPMLRKVAQQVGDALREPPKVK